MQHRSAPIPCALRAASPLQNLSSACRDVQIGVFGVVQPHAIERTEWIEMLMDNPLVVFQRAIHPNRRRATESFGDELGGGSRERRRNRHPVTRKSDRSAASAEGQVRWMSGDA